MHEESERPGLGKVIYSVNEPSEAAEPCKEPVDDEEIQQADEESFPASDPPGFAGGRSLEPTGDSGG